MRQLNVVYVVYERFLDWPVFDAQVVGLLRETSKDDCLRLTLIAFERIDRFLFNLVRIIRKSRSLKNEINSKIILLPRLAGPFGLAIAQAVVAVRFIGLRNPLVFHCRGSKGTYAVGLLKRLRPSVSVIFDIRAAEPEELLYNNQSKNVSSERFTFGSNERKYRWLSKVEKSAIETADNYSCVSEGMVMHIKEKFDISDKVIRVVPCGVSSGFVFDPEARANIRADLGLKDKLIFTYVGSMHVGQLPQLALRLFKRIKSNVPEAFLLIMTYEPQEALELLESENISNDSVLVKQVPNDQIPEMLSAADFGFLLREKSKRNQVASPIKFSEYSCCGLPVIMTDAVISASLQLHRLGIGIIFPSDLAVDKLDDSKINQDILVSRLDNTRRKRISQAMLKVYGWPSLAEKYIDHYLELAKVQQPFDSRKKRSTQVG